MFCVVWDVLIIGTLICVLRLPSPQVNENVTINNTYNG